MELNLLKDEIANNTETELRRVLSITRNRTKARKVMNISNPSMSRFLSGNESETKINIRSVSNLLAAMGYQLVPENNKSFDPNTHSAVPNRVLETMTFLSSVGHSVVIAMHEHGPDCVHEIVRNSVGHIEQG